MTVMDNRLVWVGVLLLAVGCALGLIPDSGGFSCGSPWVPDTNTAALTDAMSGGGLNAVAHCEDTLAARGILGWVAAGTGAAVLIGAMFLSAAGRQRPAAS